MSVDFPQIDQIIHASLDKRAYAQKEYVKLMNQSNNFINLTFQEYMDRISREYNSKSIVDILRMVCDVLDEENDACDNKIIFDDFVKNASLVSQALKKIIYYPSKRLIKIDKNVPANKVTRFDSKTMNWLARRSGITIQEKISPKNVIPTKVTYFTPDTMENRHTMYLFDILYDYLYDKVYPDSGEPKCEGCQFKDKKCYILYDKLKTILFLKQKIRTTDLKEVLKEKQLRQNNKLLSDKEYKQIWDAVRDIDYYEQNCKNIWINLKERYQFMSFLFVCGKIASLENIKIFDYHSQITDYEGKIAIVNDEGINIVRFYDSILDQEIIVSLKGEFIQIEVNLYKTDDGVTYKANNKINQKFNLSNIFDEFNNIKQFEEKFKELEADIFVLNKEINIFEGKIKEYDEKKQQILDLACSLSIKAKELSSNGEEEKEE